MGLNGYKQNKNRESFLFSLSEGNKFNMIAGK